MVKQESNRGSGRKVSEVGSSEEKEERERECVEAYNNELEEVGLLGGKRSTHCRSETQK